MLLLPFCEERLALLREELAEIKENFVSDPERTVKLLAAIRAALDEVAGKVKTGKFAGFAAEALFNKTVYAELYAEYIYAAEVFNTEAARPVGSAKAIRNYYRGKVAALSLYFQQHNFLYEYWRKGLDELDGMLFVAGKTVEHLFLPESPEFYAADVPSAVYLFARFIAYDRLSAELRSKTDPQGLVSQKSGLKWTGNKVGVAELAYGLYYTGQFNNGNADVTAIFEWLQSTLELDMGSVHRKFIDIRRRNTASPTKLLDRMREAILQRKDEDLKFKPNRGVGLRKPLSGEENDRD